jgi:hypothetical protein
MIGDGNAVLPWSVRFENDVAAFLIYAPVAIMFAKDID